MLRFESGEKLRGIARSYCGIDLEVADKIFHHVVDRVAFIEQFPDAAAAFIQLQIHPFLHMKKERLIAYSRRHNFRGSFEHRGLRHTVLKATRYDDHCATIPFRVEQE